MEASLTVKSRGVGARNIWPVGVCRIVALLMLAAFGIACGSDVPSIKSNVSGANRTYTYERGACRTEGTVSGENSINAGVLSIRRSCAQDLAAQAAVLGEIFRQLDRDVGLDSIDTISWGQINEADVQRRLIAEATTAESWARVVDSIQRHGVPKAIPEVVGLLRASDAFRELRMQLDELGYKLTVSAVEGVLVSKAESLAPLLREPEIPADAIVPYTSLVWFKLRRAT